MIASLVFSEAGQSVETVDVAGRWSSNGKATGVDEVKLRRK